MAMVKWLKKLNPDKTEVMLVGKAEILARVILPTLDSMALLKT